MEWYSKYLSNVVVFLDIYFRECIHEIYCPFKFLCQLNINIIAQCFWLSPIRNSSSSFDSLSILYKICFGGIFSWFFFVEFYSRRRSKSCTWIFILFALYGFMLRTCSSKLGSEGVTHQSEFLNSLGIIFQAITCVLIIVVSSKIIYCFFIQPKLSADSYLSNSAHDYNFLLFFAWYIKLFLKLHCHHSLLIILACN